jgi:predicted RNA binding protein YcfA (HicA-like mRNA interferase family)
MNPPEWERGVHLAFLLTFLQVDKMLRQDGFEFTHARGSHHHYKHPDTRKRVVVPRSSRGNKKLAIGTLRNIYRQAGWDWRTRSETRVGEYLWTPFRHL